MIAVHRDTLAECRAPFAQPCGGAEIARLVHAIGYRRDLDYGYLHVHIGDSYGTRIADFDHA